MKAWRGAPPGDYYFRTFIRLATASERLAHLNRLLAVAKGERSRNGVVIRVFAIG